MRRGVVGRPGFVLAGGHSGSGEFESARSRRGPMKYCIGAVVRDKRERS